MSTGNAETVKKIGLLTPYTGGNFGDRAIQDAVIYSIRKRYPDARIYGLTLYPEETEKLHNIKCFPISGFPVRYYQGSAFRKSLDPGENKKGVISVPMRLKNALKSIRPVDSFLKLFYEKVQMISGEARCVVFSYRMLRGCDLLIVSGGGQLDDYWGGAWGHPYALFKWALLSKLTRTKFIFLSVGTCALESRLSRMFLVWALKMASYRSFRDHTSKKMLEKMAFTKNDPVFPDLAFSYTRSTNSNKQVQRNSESVVGISPIAYLSRHWPKKNIRAFEDYLHKLSTFVIELMRKNCRIVMFATDGPDRQVIVEIMEKLGQNSSLHLHSEIEAPTIATVEDLFFDLADVDYVVASRLHGVLLSHMAGKPVIAVSYDRKVRTYMEDMGQADYCVDIDQFDVGSLREKFELLVKNRSAVTSLIRQKTSRYRDLLERQYDTVLNM